MLIKFNCVFRSELKGIRGTLIVRSILVSFNIVSRVAIFLSLVTYAYYGNALYAKQVFIITTYYNFLYDTMLHFWPESLATLGEAYIGLRRFEEFLLMPESRDEPKKGCENFNYTKDCLTKDMPKTKEFAGFVSGRYQNEEPRSQIGITFQNVSAYWASDIEGVNTG